MVIIVINQRRYCSRLPTEKTCIFLGELQPLFQAWKTSLANDEDEAYEKHEGPEQRKIWAEAETIMM
jgi:hypothetical protein